MEQATLASRKQWVGRLAAVFYLASGALSLVTLPLSSPDADTRALAAVSISALAIGAVAWFVDWGRYGRRASLALVPPGLALIAAGNAFGGTDYYTYGVFFLLVFVWLGFAHAPGTSLAVAPLAAVAYVVPLLFLPSRDLPEGLGSAAVVLPLCVLIGEALSRGSERTLRTEAALQRERENRERERQVDSMKTTFLRAASHELRTPITVSRGHLEVLDASAEPREITETVHLVVDELARMGRLVDDITMLTRLEDPSALRTEDLRGRRPAPRGRREGRAVAERTALARPRKRRPGPGRPTATHSGTPRAPLERRVPRGTGRACRPPQPTASGGMALRGLRRRRRARVPSTGRRCSSPSSMAHGQRGAGSGSRSCRRSLAPTGARPVAAERSRRSSAPAGPRRSSS